MALDAPTRDSLVRFLADIVGPAHAVDVVARLELDVNDLATRADVADIRSDVADIRSDVAALDRRLGALEGKVEIMQHELIGVFRGELLAAVTSQTRSMLIGMVSTAAVFAAAVLGAVQLG
jgi:hypothetical protein